MNVQDAIIQSVQKDQTVYIPWTQELQDELDGNPDVDDSAVFNDGTYYWGFDEDGNEWQIVLVKYPNE
jgi:hypothetical protein